MIQPEPLAKLVVLQLGRALRRAWEADRKVALAWLILRSAHPCGRGKINTLLSCSLSSLSMAQWWILRLSFPTGWVYLTNGLSGR